MICLYLALCHQGGRLTRSKWKKKVSDLEMIGRLVCGALTILVVFPNGSIFSLSRLLTINNTHPTQAKFIPTLNAVKRRQKTPK